MLGVFVRLERRGRSLPSDHFSVSVFVDIVRGQALVAARAIDLVPDLALELGFDGLAKAIATNVGLVVAAGCDFIVASR